mmetsp:Transcript_11122/g.22788  ORF Transcript_11122/g.22788 Transcript_11122/m.22788 type:complete len:345 (-) Transcript_11122:153-1187(-)|eukprot:CAMPEP_0172445810 /NCGR_PEP_ID=MMETSP1065-20121228/5598_1 /TAXON_ID=265537 /ORGANISM="Amphiprora paludosa, Strain CCMP125" /LENGTH=344 /DNA_ID=CAMNT_0013196795 /DNA_START=64 /DNA_END=1098 /DNA_ORIENTATION=+
MTDFEDDVLPPYYAFIWTIAVIVLSLLLMLISVKEHGVTTEVYFRSMFRTGEPSAFVDEVGHSSMDILSTSVLGTSLGLLILGFVQYEFKLCMGIFMALTSSLGFRLLFTHKWSFIYKNPKPAHPGKEPFTTATNRFQDLSQPFARVLLAGIGQVILLILYIWSVFDSGRPAFDQLRNYVFYIVGVFLVMTYVIGNDLYNNRRKDRDFWTWFFYHVQSKTHGQWMAEGEEEPMAQVKPLEADIRYFLDTLINSIGLACLQVAIPVQLAGNSTPLDFVLNTLAAFFIIELDDADDVILSYHELEPNNKEIDVPLGGKQIPISREDIRESFTGEGDDTEIPSDDKV